MSNPNIKFQHTVCVDDAMATFSKKVKKGLKIIKFSVNAQCSL